MLKENIVRAIQEFLDKHKIYQIILSNTKIIDPNVRAAVLAGRPTWERKKPRRERENIRVDVVIRLGCSTVQSTHCDGFSF